MSNREEIVTFFEKHIGEFRGTGGGGGCELPEIVTELTPRDFLDFAEKDISGDITERALVNATSNLKRAVDCQLDTFLCQLHLDELYRKKRLGVDRKLGFLSKSGLFRSKSIEKLNKFRNRLEHHYEIPKIEDVEVYFDLVVAFVSVVEGSLSLVGSNSHLRMDVESGGQVFTEFTYEAPSIEIILEHKGSNYLSSYICNLSGNNCGVEEIEEFAFFFKVHRLLRLYEEGISSQKHVINMLRQ